MCKIRLLALILVIASTTEAQVLTPAEIRDLDLRSLQQQYINDLKVVGQDVQGLQLKYRFLASLVVGVAAANSRPGGHRAGGPRT